MRSRPELTADETLIFKALELALRVHGGQKRKDGSPYILHPLRVMLRLEGETAKMLALLHDVVEDSPVTISEIREMGFPAEVVEALALLTHREGVPYEDYVRRIAENPLAVEVKLADLADNLDLSSMPIRTAKDRERVLKYRRAQNFLRRIGREEGPNLK